MEVLRPVGPAERRALTFHTEAGGTFVADSPLDIGGQWDLFITVQANGAMMHTTRRLRVP